LTAAAPVPTDVESYLARVRAALADVPPEERSELLAEVEASLYESAAESGGSIAARLGPPEDFAAELRSAAGLHTAAAQPAPGARETIERLLTSPRVAAATAAGRELAPIWWAVRGYLAVAALALLLDRSWSFTYEAVPRFGTAAGGLALIVVAVAVSIALGLWNRRRGGALVPAIAVANIVLLAAAIPVGAHLAQRAPTQLEIVTVPANQPGLAYNGTPIENIYPYTRDGRLLHDVFLYTSQGQPLDVSTVVPDPNRRVPRTASGRPVFNIFPIRYFEPGTRLVRHPNAGPQVRLPRLATPALRPR
jgi:hypothetical protein